VIDRMRALLRRREVEMKPIDVPQMLDDVATLLRPDAAVRHIAMEIDVAAELPAVHGDRVQLQQVLLNLILNGMDAIGSGDRRRIAVTGACEGGGELCFRVADTGTGIDPAHLERVFEPFFTTKPSGIGMGLSISRSIVEAHGGHLTAANNAEGGATFRFTLPAAA
jgi:two-component system sensor kinase FixL